MNKNRYWAVLLVLLTVLMVVAPVGAQESGTEEKLQGIGFDSTPENLARMQALQDQWEADIAAGVNEASVEAADVATSAALAAADDGYVCFPTCSEIDSKMLALAGTGLSTLAGDSIEIRIAVPGTAASVEIGFFDGDGDGQWDIAQVPLDFTLYADPLGDASGTAVAGSWTSSQMADNLWHTVSVATAANALSVDGNYHYLLRVMNPDASLPGRNSFKIRTDASLSIVPQAFAFISALAKSQDIPIVYPNYPDLTTTTYDGNWTFYLQVPDDVNFLELWDGDLDYGSYDLVDNDIDDPDTLGDPFLPPWALGTAAVYEGVAVGVNGATGAPNDDNGFEPLRRSPSVNYTLYAPDGTLYANDNPSGNLEWEMLRIDTAPFDRNVMDYHAATIPAGLWRVEMTGVDIENLNAWRFAYDLVGNPESDKYRIGDYVWYDTNNNGVQDNGETGIPGVTVNLIDATGAVVDSVTTSRFGLYYFDVVPGQWTTQVAPENFTTGPLQGYAPSVEYDGEGDNAGGPDNARTQVVVDQDILTYDYGYVTGAIGDYVWLDANGNGAQDDGPDAGIANVMLTIYEDVNGNGQFDDGLDLIYTAAVDADGATGTGMTTTDDDGYYLFTKLPAGNYIVVVNPNDLPIGVTPTWDYDGIGTPNVAAVTITTGETNLDVDYGYTPAICPPDTNLVEIDFETDAMGNVLHKGQIIDNEYAAYGLTFSTNRATGLMIFDSTNPTGGDWDLGTPNQAFGGPGRSSSGDATNNDTALGKVLIISEDGDSSDPDDHAGGGKIVVTSQQPFETVAFDILDLDEGETGMAEAFDAAGTLLADESLGGLGDNSLQSRPLRATNVSKLQFALSSSGAVGSIELCIPDLPVLGTIGDRVWEDRNGDGVQDANEPGINDVTVQLVDGNGAVVKTQTTSGDGGYLFTDLATGNYTVVVVDSTLPSGLQQTYDADGLATPHQSSLVLGAGETNLVQDFGYQPSEECIPCIDGVERMTLKLTYRTSNGDRDERIRVRVDGLGGQVLYDSWDDGNSDPGLPVGAEFSFDIPSNVAKIVVTVRGDNHPNEYVKATFYPDCEMQVGDEDGNSYITFKVVSINVPLYDICPVGGGGGQALYLSSSSGGDVGFGFADEDILSTDLGNGNWAKVLDLSSKGVTKDIDAFAILPDGSGYVMSFDGWTDVPGVGGVDDSDIVKYNLGSGNFSLYFDGSDVGLSTDNEDIDALTVLANGKLIVSTLGNVDVSGVSRRDEDLLKFSPSSLGNNTSGSWSVYLDGSDVGLASSGDEDIKGVWVDEANGDIYLTTLGNFGVSGVSGDSSDVFICHAPTLGIRSGCGSFSKFWDGSSNGFYGEVVDALHVGETAVSSAGVAGPAEDIDEVEAEDADDLDVEEGDVEEVDDDDKVVDDVDAGRMTNFIFLPFVNR